MTYVDADHPRNLLSNSKVTYRYIHVFE